MLSTKDRKAAAVVQIAPPAADGSGSSSPAASASGVSPILADIRSLYCMPDGANACVPLHTGDQSLISIDGRLYRHRWPSSESVLAQGSTGASTADSTLPMTLTSWPRSVGSPSRCPQTLTAGVSCSRASTGCTAAWQMSQVGQHLDCRSPPSRLNLDCTPSSNPVCRSLSIKLLAGASKLQHRSGCGTASRWDPCGATTAAGSSTVAASIRSCSAV